MKPKSLLPTSTRNILLHLILVVMLGTSGVAATLMVSGNNPACSNAPYTTITAAINAAAPGDTIAICPALYPEQLVITKPLTLRGIPANDTQLSPAVTVDQVLVQPSSMQTLAGLPVEAVITVMNTSGVNIENLAVDASNNGVSGCTPAVADIHYYNASGTVTENALFGAQLSAPQSCVAIFPGNGFGVLVDSSEPGPFHVSITNNSIHDYTKDGVQAINAGVNLKIGGNTITGAGPAGGFAFQFAVFVLNGAAADIDGNVITEGLCGTLSPGDCVNARSEGITLRAPGDGTTVDHNVISNAQSGIFINGGNRLRISNNLISNIGPMDGMDIQGAATGYFTNSVIEGNTLFNLSPISNNSCGIFEVPGTGVSGNTISHTTVNDAFCGVGYVTADHLGSGNYRNTLYPTLNTDLFPTPPPAIEP